MATKPVPVPLFNFRKRQRQAMVSDPQSMSIQSLSSNTADKINNVQPQTDNVEENSNHERKSEYHQIDRSGKFQQYRPLTKNNSVNNGRESFPDSSPSKFQSQRFQTSTRDSFGSSNKLFSKGNNAMSIHAQNNQSKIHPPTDNSKIQGYNHDNNLHSRGKGRSESNLVWNTDYRNNASAVSSSASLPQGQTSLRGSGNLQQQVNKAYTQKTINYDVGKRENFQEGFKPTQGGQLKVQSGTFQSRFGGQTTSHNAKGKASSDSKSINRQSSTTSYSPNGSNNTLCTTSRKANTFDAVDVKTPKTTFTKSKSFSNVKKRLDTTMRFFTCPISLLRAWCAAQPFDGPVVFEVYGKVISATTSDKTGTGKEFVLQDDSSSVKCTFYEIDRQLPTLVRGQIHRVVGSFDKKRGVVKAISVRQAAMEEQQVHRTSYEKTVREMQLLGFLINEP